MRKRQVFLAPLAHWLMHKPFRAVVRNEIAQSRLWKMDILHDTFRVAIVAALDDYRCPTSDSAWLEEVWNLFVLCGWVHRKIA